MQLFGTMELGGSKLVYFPNGNRNHPIDFSQVIHE
jgi:hypothetical protein